MNKAKNTVASKIGETSVYEPSLYIELPSRVMLNELEIGQCVELIIRGTVKGLSSSTRNYGESTESHHSLDIGEYKVKIAKSGKWEKMADDFDEEG